MSHELEIINGQASFVAARTPGWHRLGTVVDRDDLTIPEALVLGNLNDWNVRKVPVFGAEANGEPIEAPGRAMTVRRNLTDPDAPAQMLGLVSDIYEVIQNEEAFQWAETVVDGGLTVETAGSIYGGRQVFMLFRAPDVLVGGTDRVLQYLHVATSHDGSLGVTYNRTGVRVVCANTQADALRRQTPRYTVRHYRGQTLDGRVEAAREALGVVFDGSSQFQKEAEAWLARGTGPAEVEAVIAALFPEPNDPTDRQKQLVAAKRDTYRQTLAGPTNAGINDTAWGLLQAAWEMDEWMGRGDDDAKALRSYTTGDGRRAGIGSRIADVLSL